MKRMHKMPFGAEIQTDGAVRFRLWAPAAQRVELCLGQHAPDNIFEMQSDTQGWYELTTDRASVGSHYSYRINGDLRVPDPASRFNPGDVHNPSVVTNPCAWDWNDEEWPGRPWEEAIIYELHIGTFTPEGTFFSAKQRLDYLVELGITAIEIMPVAEFPGSRNWGYDGVLLFAPDASYGTPDDLKDFIQTAHHKGLMVLLDVVYNHFGPDGNYLHLYAPQFFTERHCTPWGAAINFDGDRSRTVRDFFLDNALYWLNEFHFDGLRLDAVHAIIDDSKINILTELAEQIRRGSGAQRHIHLILENDNNQARFLKRSKDGEALGYSGQWNDDIHHVMHVLLTHQTDGYYVDHADKPIQRLGRCLIEGFDYQGQVSQHRDNTKRGEPTKDIPLSAFISFLQNHDQVGNNPFGTRISQVVDKEAVQAAMAVLLLAPSVPMLFMGEEFASVKPFPFFCNFADELAKLVTEGRRKEFARFPEFNNPASRERIPDPNALATFNSAILDWDSLQQPMHREYLNFYRALLEKRMQHIVPRLHGMVAGNARFKIITDRALFVEWLLPDQFYLRLICNLSDQKVSDIDFPSGDILYNSPGLAEKMNVRELTPWSVAWFTERRIQ